MCASGDCCPMCGEPVDLPSLDELVAPLDSDTAAVLEAMFANAGQWFMYEALFGLYYASDPNGGPSYTAMYLKMQKVMGEIAECIAPYGLEIAHRYRKGWRLVLTATKPIRTAA